MYNLFIDFVVYINLLIKVSIYCYILIDVTVVKNKIVLLYFFTIKLFDFNKLSDFLYLII